MHRSLLVLIFILGSTMLWAIDESCYWNKNFLEITFNNADLDVEDLFSLSELNSSNQAYFTDKIWCIFYTRLKGSPKKVREGLTYKQNCQVLNRAYSLCHTAQDSPLQRDNSYVAPNKIDYCEMASEQTLTDDKFTQLLLKVGEKHPLVFCSCFGIFAPPSPFKQYVIDVFDMALEKDIIFIIPVGNNAQILSDRSQDYDIRKRWPHVLWVSVWNDEGPAPYANYGALVHLGAASSNGTSNAALGIAPLIIQLRRLRLDLSAGEIIDILVNSALKTEKSEELMPKGGIVNARAAVLACQSYARKSL